VEQFTSELRLGDVIDDHCVKCRRVTNHSIVSLVEGKAAKVRCRTCYHDHDYRNELAPPSKKDLKKQDLFKEVLSSVVPSEDTGENSSEDPVASASESASEELASDETLADEAAPVTPAKKPKTRSKRA